MEQGSPTSPTSQIIYVSMIKSCWSGDRTTSATHLVLECPPLCAVVPRVPKPPEISRCRRQFVATLVEVLRSRRHSRSKPVIVMMKGVKHPLSRLLSICVCNLEETTATGRAVSDVWVARFARHVSISTHHNVFIVADRAFHDYG